MLDRVLEQVGDDPLESQLVHDRRGRRPPADLDRQVGEAVAAGHPLAQLLDVDLLGVQVGRPGIDAGELEQVHHHRVEPPHLADHDVERLLGPIGQLAPARVHHLGGRGEGGDRRAQLVADVAGEARLPFDTGLHGVSHLVEGVGQAVEVGVPLGGHTRVEPSRGDLAGGVGDPRQRAQ